jgi:hypothetical protein
MNQLKKHIQMLQNDLIALGIYNISYSDILDQLYDAAMVKKQYVKAGYLKDLMIENLNS